MTSNYFRSGRFRVSSAILGKKNIWTSRRLRSSERRPRRLAINIRRRTVKERGKLRRGTLERRKEAERGMRRAPLGLVLFCFVRGRLSVVHFEIGSPSPSTASVFVITKGSVFGGLDNGVCVRHSLLSVGKNQTYIYRVDEPSFALFVRPVPLFLSLLGCFGNLDAYARNVIVFFAASLFPASSHLARLTGMGWGRPALSSVRFFVCLCFFFFASQCRARRTMCSFCRCECHST